MDGTLTGVERHPQSMAAAATRQPVGEALHLPRHAGPRFIPTTIADLPDGALHTILDLLGPRDLVAAAATCRRWGALASDAASDRAWRAFFTRRWRTADASVGDTLGVCTALPWRAAYGRRVAEAAALASARPALDSLAGGHRGPARAVALLPSAGVVASGGADRVVRLFDLAAGLPVSTSRPLPWAVRCLAAGGTALAAASGSDARIALWRAGGSGESVCGGRAVPPWDVGRRPATLQGHSGPVAGVALGEEGGATPPRLYSASWDCSVRVWDVSAAGAASPCLAAKALADWVWSAAPRGGRVVCAEGRGAAVLDGETLALLARVPPFSTAQAAAPYTLSTPVAPCARVDGSRDGRTLFVAHADSGVASYDLRAPGRHGPASPARSALLVPPGTPSFPAATSIAFDDPWLALGLGPSGVVLLDARRGGEGSAGGAPSPSSFRRLGTGATAAGGVLGVDLAGPWLAAACSSGTVLTWRWDAAAAAAARAVGARAAGSHGRPRQCPPQAAVAESWEDAAIAA